jgi:hypothetical protein
MVKDTAVCESCAQPLDPRDEPRDLAHIIDPRHYCPRCRMLFCPAPTPTMHAAAPRSSFTRQVG